MADATIPEAHVTKMKKLPTTIILLCFSVSANADIYICESELLAELRGTENVSGEYKRGRLIVNTEEGFKSYLQGQSINSENKYSRVDYKGSCSVVENKFVSCSNLERIGDSIQEQDILLDTKWLKYVRTSKGVQHRADGTLESGSCTKV